MLVLQTLLAKYVISGVYLSKFKGGNILMGSGHPVTVT